MIERIEINIKSKLSNLDWLIERLEWHIINKTSSQDTYYEVIRREFYNIQSLLWIRDGIDYVNIGIQEV